MGESNPTPAKLDSIIYNFHITATKEKENNMMNRIHTLSIGHLASKLPVLLGEPQVTKAYYNSCMDLKLSVL